MSQRRRALRHVACRALAASAALLLASACAGVVLPQPAASLVPPTPLESAEALRRAGDLDAAARAYAALRQATPGEVRAHLGYVRTLLEGGRRSVVREEYAARAIAPEALEVDRVLAERLAGDGASSTLRDLYARAAAREPAVPWWPLALAEVELAEADAWRLRREEGRAAGDRGSETDADRQARGALLRADRALDRVATLEGAPFEGEGLAVEVHGVPPGREVEVQVDLPRLRQNPLRPLQRGLKPSDPAHAAAIRENHARANDKRVLAGLAAVEGGVARVRLAPAPGALALSDPALGGTLHVRAWLLGAGPSGLGATTVEVAAAGAPAPR
ncbi:MAG: hypothetical protein ACKOSS_06310 [Planctomycetia bacterium]